MSMPRMMRIVKLLLVWWLAAWPGYDHPGYGQDPILTPPPGAPDTARSITAAVTELKGQLFSGLFITEPGTGWVLYRPSKPVEPPRIGFEEFERKYRFGAPAGLG